MNQENKICVLSYGGGVNSSALFFYIAEKGMPLDPVIFADTQEETPGTYDAVERMKRECEQRCIEFVTVTRGNLYDYYFNKKAVMSMMMRDCTSKFKIAPIRKYLRDKYGKKAKFIMYIGIAWDEATRVRTSDVQYIEHAYPFVDDRITREGNRDILSRHDFPATKSGCKGCIYMKKKAWIKMLIENPTEFQRHKRLEMNNSRYPDITLNGKYSLESLEKAWKNQSSLADFTDNEETCSSINGGCFL